MLSAPNIHSLIEAQVDRTPAAIALVLEDQQLSYGELDARANALAHELQALGVGPDVRVGVLLERSFAMVVAMLAVWKAGGAYLPLEPDFPDQRLHDTLADATPRLVLTSQLLAPRIPAQVLTLCFDQAQAAGLVQSSQRPVSTVAPHHVSYIIYTSGSTGKPKGALLPHRAICNHMAWMVSHYGLTPQDHVLQKTPFSFDASVWEFLAPLITGARLVLARPGGHRDMPYLAATIVQHQVTTLQLVPSVLQLLVDEPSFSHCTSLKRVFCGGEALTTKLAQRFFAKLGAELHNLYGPTECCIDTTVYACPRVGSQAGEPAVQPIGKPIWNTTHHVLDEHMQPVPAGAEGELYIGGHGLALGYLNRPTLTAERFVPNPFVKQNSQNTGDSAKLYRTGDRVRCNASGDYEFLGRVDFQVKLNGFRIELGEIESVLESHASVRQAVAVLRADARDTTGRKLLVAYVAPAAGAQPNAQTLREHMARQLPSHMLPAACVVLPSFPLTTSGKVDRQSLPEPQWGLGAAVAQEKPNTATEQAVARVWADALGLPLQGLSLQDDFFALGGDSLALMQVGLDLRTHLGADIAPETLFTVTQLQALALAVDTAVSAAVDAAATRQTSVASASVLVPTAHTQSPASVAQASFASATKAMRGWPLFNTSEVIRFQAGPDVVALQAAVDAVVMRHESLRTVLRIEQGEVRQQVQPPSPTTLETHAAASQADEQSTIRSLVQQPLNPYGAPPVRWCLVGQCLVLIVHHSMTDGHSTETIVHDLLTLYAAHGVGKLTGHTAALPRIEVRYLDWSVWQHERGRAGQWLEAQRYWQHTLQGQAGPVRLPTDKPRRAIARWQGGRETLRLPPALQASLKTLAAQHQATLFIALLTGFDALLLAQTGQTDLLVGTTVANRTVPGVRHTAGCFITALPLRVQLHAAMSWVDALAQVRQVALGAYAHQELPLGMAFESLPTRGSLGAGPPLPVWLELHDHRHGWDTEFAHLGLQRWDVDRGISESELSLEIDDGADGLCCQLQYKSELFNPCRMQALLKQYHQLLQAMVDNPQQTLLGVAKTNLEVA
jgi:amino acid adenylation domain-containing protein